MPRTARQISESGILHIMMRGINKQPIFLQEEDYQYFYYLINQVKKKSTIALFGYCLMPNHIHFLVRSTEEGPGKFIQSVATSYAQYFNKKFTRIGHVFQNRYKSVTIQKDEQLIAALRYIHYNPVKAGLCKQMANYLWSSFNDYITTNGPTDTEFVLSIFGNLSAWMKYNNETPKEEDLDDTLKEKPNNQDVVLYIDQLVSVPNFYILDFPQQAEIIRAIKNETNASIKQLVEFLHISKHYVVKALKK